MNVNHHTTAASTVAVLHCGCSEHRDSMDQMGPVCRMDC